MTKNNRVGLNVLYTLTEYDAREIVQNRRNAGIATARGNDPREGQTYPAIIVADHVHEAHRPRVEAGEFTVSGAPVLTWESYIAGISVNLQVFLDGTDVFWATSRTEYDATKHGDWGPLPEGQEPQTLEEEQGVWRPDPKGHFQCI